MKKRSLAGLIALFMVIAFLAVSCDNAAGGGNSPKVNATKDDFIALWDKLGDDDLDDLDDLDAISLAFTPPMPEVDDEGKLLFENGMTFDGDKDTGGTIIYTNFKVKGYDSGKELTLNGTLKVEISTSFTKYTSKVKVEGSTNGPVKSNFTISGGMDEESEELPESSGTLTIGSQTFDIKDIINVINDIYSA